MYIDFIIVKMNNKCYNMFNNKMSFDKIFNRFYLIIKKYSLTNSKLVDKKFIEYYDNRSTDLGVCSNSKKYYI
jgi:hypothetical protein